MQTFKDNFSKQAGIYAKYRPHYPTELFDFLSSLTGAHLLAWDCGTGNGQAAIGLSAFYKNVIATDPSEEQIRNGMPKPNVKYLVEKAEKNSIQSNSVDLITIANALHWFDFDLFYAEVRRVTKKKGVIAAWTYSLPSISKDIDQIVEHFDRITLNEYWRPENWLVEKEYETIPFPFRLINAPQLTTEKSMNLHDFIGYLNTWSATQRFINENKFNPTDELRNELSAVWKDIETEKKLTWKLVLKVGCVNE